MSRLIRVCVALALCLIAALLGVASFAAPTDVGAPDPASPGAQQLRSEDAGAFSVGKNGAASYSYAFRLPPARGFAPSLTMNYSSHGGVRGDIAQGFSLGPIPVIRRDVQREGVPGQGRYGPTEYTAFFGGSVSELVVATGDVTYLPPGATSVTPYRARIDHDFTRFERVRVDTPDRGSFYYWIALTTDGKIYFFGDNYFEDSSLPHETNRFGEEYYLSHVMDRWQNTVTYQYDKVVDSANVEVDRVLSTIHYNSHPPPKTLASHTRVRLSWSAASTCAIAGAQGIPVGASLDFSTGARRIRGAKKLTSITAQVRDFSISGLPKWRDVHVWTFGYDSSRENCTTTPVAAHRLLTSISESGTVMNVAGAVTTPGLTVTFTYGRDRNYFQTTSGIPLPRLTIDSLATAANQSAYGLVMTAMTRQGSDYHPLAPTYSTLLDMDGDGLIDLVQSNGYSGTADMTCRATWYKNTGGQFDLARPHSFALPNAPLPPMPDGWDAGTFAVRRAPMGQNPRPERDTEGECSLAGSYFGFIGYTERGFLAPRSASTLYYRWVDMDGDGKVDLVTQLYGSPGYARLREAAVQYPECACTPDPNRDPRTGACDPVTQFGLCGHHHVVRIYRNVGGSLDLDHPIVWRAAVAFAGLPRMEDYDRDPARPLVDIRDMTGDHLPDLVTAWFNQRAAWDGRRSCWYISGTHVRTQLNVFWNDGQFFSPRLLYSAPMVVEQMAWQDGECVPTYSVPVFDGSLMDMNNDGLADIIRSVQGAPYEALYNAGGFKVAPGTTPLFGSFSRSRQETLPNALRDFDGDGIPDFPCMDGQSTGCNHYFNDPVGGVLFGNGGGFDRIAPLGDIWRSPTMYHYSTLR